MTPAELVAGAISFEPGANRAELPLGVNMIKHFAVRSWASGLLFAAFSSQAIAQETVTYQYDAKGRVTNVTRSGGPSNGVATSYQYDTADNRANVTVTNSPNGNGNGSGDGATVNQKTFVVVPLNGYSLIFIN